MSKSKNSSAYYLLVNAHHVVSSEYTWARVTCLKTCLKVGQLYCTVSQKTWLVWFNRQFPQLTRMVVVLDTLSDPQHKLFYIYLCSGPLCEVAMSEKEHCCLCQLIDSLDIFPISGCLGLLDRGHFDWTCLQESVDNPLEDSQIRNLLWMLLDAMTVSKLTMNFSDILVFPSE